VPAGTTLLRIALYDAETDGHGTDDLDLYLYCPSGQCTAADAVLASTNPTSNEAIDIVYPQAGDYVIDVHGYSTDEVTGGPGAKFRLFAWAVVDSGPADLGAVGPGTVTTGQSADVTVSWQGLAQGTRYLGAIVHTDGSRNLGFTSISVVGP
jgi:hypothetical protein